MTDDTLSSFAQARLDCRHVEEYRYWSLGEPGEPDEIVCRFCGTVLETWNP